MPRPALSASRGMDVIDFLAAMPGSAMTLSQIARGIDVNLASCHAVLNGLAERGYLTRDGKTYSLGPALVAMGHAALRAQGVIVRAQAAAEAIGREHGVPVSLTRVIGDEIIGVFSIPGPDGIGKGVRPGDRLPLMPPVGAPFLAWSSEQAIADWIARRGGAIDEAVIGGWRHALELVRRRGYQVLLRSPVGRSLPKLMSEFAAGKHAANYKEQIVAFFESTDESHKPVEAIEAATLYDVILIAVPIFDAAGDAVYNLCIGDLPEKISGAKIEDYAESLMRNCVEIMRGGR